MKFFLSLLTLWGVAASATSARADQCVYRQEISGQMVASKFYTLSLGCVIVVTPLNKPDLKYREYYFDERGRFMIFDSQPGNYETATATQSYFLFPRRQEPDFKIQKTDGSIQVTMSSGRTITISSQEPKILSFPGASFTEPAAYGLQPKDFLAIQSYPDLLLDAGSRVGGTGYGKGQADSTSTFRDPAGESCTVVNRELFDYDHILYAEPTFLYDTQAKLAAFLKRRCPKLRWDPASSNFERALRTTQSMYQGRFQTMGLGFQWAVAKAVTVADIQIRNSDVWLRVNPTLVASQKLSQDDWQTILCHEVGHVLGGAPYSWVNQDEGGEYSAEGQADYFAAAKCLRSIWTDKTQNALAVAALKQELVTKIKARGCASNQCIRIVAAANHLLSALSPEETFSVDRKSKETVSQTQTFPVSAPAQCRLDTMIAGALCQIDPAIPFSSSNQRDGACVSGPGARPACWFHSDDLNGIY